LIRWLFQLASTSISIPRPDDFIQLRRNARPCWAADFPFRDFVRFFLNQKLLNDLSLGIRGLGISKLLFEKSYVLFVDVSLHATTPMHADG
jgi:hypothetical protein